MTDVKGNIVARLRNKPVGSRNQATKAEPNMSVNQNDITSEFSGDKQKIIPTIEQEIQTLILDFTFESETPGTFKFKECDKQGNILAQKDYIVGTLYLRKDKIESDCVPKSCTVTIVTKS